MKWKIFSGLEFLAIVLLVLLLAARCVRLRTLEPAVREPAAPGESTLTYTPPPPPQVSVEALAGFARLLSLFKPTVEKVTDSIYLARGFALGSSILVITPAGLVIVDTTESPEAAKKILAEFRKLSDLPIRTIIYTHGHLDHVRGASVFYQPGVEVIATADWIKFVQQDNETLKPFIRRGRKNQAGMAAPEFNRLELPFRSPLGRAAGFSAAAAQCGWRRLPGRGWQRAAGRRTA